MKLATIRVNGAPRAVEADDGRLIDLGATDLGEFLAHPDWTARAAAATAPASYDAASADFAPLIPNPAKVVCTGLNYRSHIQEMGRELPGHPTLFAKFRTPGAAPTTTWPSRPRPISGRSNSPLSSTPVRLAAAEQAAAAIAGFTVLNKLSARDWQFRTREWPQGKIGDAPTPVGPYLVTPDELPGGTDPAPRLTTTVDGAVMQDGTTADPLFKPAALVEYISTISRLNPADIIATGTSGGVGNARKPPVFLAGGKTAIEGVGACVNKMVKETPA